MDIELALVGADASEATTRDLQDWLRREQLPGLRIRQARGPAEPGQMGLEPLTILSLVLQSAVVVELARSLHTWLKTRRPKVRVNVRSGDREVSIDAENVDELRLIEKITTLASS